MALGQRDNNGRAGNLEATIQTRLGELICDLLLDRARSNDEIRRSASPTQHNSPTKDVMNQIGAIK